MKELLTRLHGWMRGAPVSSVRPGKVPDTNLGMAIGMAILLASCGGGDAPPPPAGGDTGSTQGVSGSGSGSMMATRAVQVGSYADSTTATALRDSLDAAGWLAIVRGADVEGRRVWRVLLSPSTSSRLPELIAHALRGQGRDALVVGDSSRISMDADVTLVNNGTHGMASRSRWVLPGDRHALLIVHDPVSVEAEALPDGFVFASEGGPFLIQRDSVWDVNPSPEWDRLAYSRAFMLRAVEGESVPTATWRRVARAVGMPEDSIRRSAFMTSGMVPSYGFAQPVVVDLDQSTLQAGTVARGSERVLPIAGGWRVRWTRDGQLAVGSPPQRVQDDEPSQTFRAADPVTGAVSGSMDRGALAGVQWVMGPVMDISIDTDLREARSLGTERGSVESRGGWVRVDGRIVGPGLVLAATRTGMFVAALAPRVGAGEYDAKTQPVVYRIMRR